jgi:hypothetical protein
MNIQNMYVFDGLNFDFSHRLFSIDYQFKYLRLYECDFAENEISNTKLKYGIIKIDVCDLIR